MSSPAPATARKSPVDPALLQLRNMADRDRGRFSSLGQERSMGPRPHSPRLPGAESPHMTRLVLRKNAGLDFKEEGTGFSFSRLFYRIVHPLSYSGGRALVEEGDQYYLGRDFHAARHRYNLAIEEMGYSYPEVYLRRAKAAERLLPLAPYFAELYHDFKRAGKLREAAFYAAKLKAKVYDKPFETTSEEFDVLLEHEPENEANVRRWTLQKAVALIKAGKEDEARATVPFILFENNWEEPSIFKSITHGYVYSFKGEVARATGNPEAYPSLWKASSALAYAITELRRDYTQEKRFLLKLKIKNLRVQLLMVQSYRAYAMKKSRHHYDQSWPYTLSSKLVEEFQEIEAVVDQVEKRRILNEFRIVKDLLEEKKYRDFSGDRKLGAQHEAESLKVPGRIAELLRDDGESKKTR